MKISKSLISPVTEQRTSLFLRESNSKSISIPRLDLFAFTRVTLLTNTTTPELLR